MKKDRIVRRSLLTGGIGAAAAWLTSHIASSRAGAASGEPMILGQTNRADTPTALEFATQAEDKAPALRVTSEGDHGLVVQARDSIVVLGARTGTGPISVTTTASAGGIARGSGLGFGGMSPGIGLLGGAGLMADLPLSFTIPQRVGVVGVSDEPAGGEIGVLTAGVLGTSRGAVGMLGASDTNVGGVGVSLFGIGLVGSAGSRAVPVGVTQTAAGVGVVGVAPGIGIAGISTIGSLPMVTTLHAGVMGAAMDSGGVGVMAAHSAGGIALEVSGRLRLSTAGFGVVNVGSDMAVVDDPMVTRGSNVIATLLTEPGRATLNWVEPGDGQLTVHLNAKVMKTAVRFCYLLIEPKRQ